MYQRKPFQSKVLPAVALFAAACAATPAAAQSSSGPPAMVDAGVVRLIPGMTAEFEALQKERVAMYKSENYKGSRQVYQTIRGNNHEYRVITPLNKFGDLDDAQQIGPDGWSDSWFSRIFKTIDNRTAGIYQVRADLSVPDPPDRTPGMTLLIITEVNYGKAAEYEAVMKEIQAAYKKVNETGLGVYRSRIGASRRAWVSAYSLDNWADLDTPGPLRRALGEEGVRKLLSKLQGVVGSSQRIVIRHRPDLSYSGGGM